jgi:hypothetical protein
MRSEHPVTAFR